MRILLTTASSLFFSMTALAYDGIDIAALPPSVARDAGLLEAHLGMLRGDEHAALEGYLLTLSHGENNGAHRERALQIALLADDVDTAVRLAKTLPDVPEDPTMVWLLRMAIAAKNNDASTTLVWADRVRRETPELLQLDLLRAYAERGRGVAVDSVIRQLGDAPEDPAQAARYWYHVGRMQAQIGNFDAAETAVARAVGLEPNALFSTLLLADIWRAQGRADEAAALMDDYSEANPGMRLMGLPDAAAPAPHFDTGLDGDLASVLFDFGIIVWGQGGEAPARQLLNLALWLAPDQPYALYYSAIVEEYGGHLETARDRFAALATDPSLGLTARLRLAETLFKLGQTTEAYAEVGQLLKHQPEEPSVLRARGEMAFELNHFAEAKKRFKQLWPLTPESSPAPLRARLAFMIGAAAERGKDFKDAERWLKTSLDILPENPSVLNYLGYMWVEQNKNLDEAFLMLQTALVLSPQDGAITDSVGWAYYMQDNLEAAEAFVEKAAELEPDDPVILDHLGDIYAERGRTEEARWQWGRALDRARDAGDDEKLIKSLTRKLR
ncbi:MAG: hypothetical protein COY40_04715 [Alphaproteobacteria bacterium CG_4_10_14_0_8_um_filter_53_9]|nr:MAG: hypothetical protein COY40_04715 [Alphaproteobacteria bacterium CG_4_10_14_0_8_um_filter_53_9]